ncbi:MAG: type II secretion system F family protein [Acidobacteria bacterium]|nr:type II secretion system F family protein [Acidobacteriota bacterium]
MAFFQYKAITAEGKIIEGTLEAADERTALSRLEQQGQLPIKVFSEEARAGWLPEIRFPWRRKRVTQQDLLVFTQELATLSRAGLPLDRSLTILSELTENSYLREVVKDLLSEIKGGRSLSEALSLYPRVFPKLYVNMIRAGEMAGVQNSILERLISYLEGAEELRNYFVSSLVYPVILALVGSASVVVMVTFVIPKFAAIFENAGAPIPLPMQLMLNLSLFVTGYWWLLLICALAVAIFFRRRLATEEGRLKWDRMVLRMPLLGTLFQKMEVSRFSRTLGTLLTSAVPLIPSINLVKEVISNQAIASTMDRIKSGVKKGEGLSKPIREAGIFPPLALHLLEVGEETGRLDAMLLQIAETYDRELRTTLKRLVALFEPAIILIMGLVIGVMVVSMLYSIFSINDVPL